MKLTFWFFRTAAAILLITSLAKIYSATGRAQILLMLDPLFGITNKHLMLIVGGLELLGALFLLVSRDNLMRALLILWLSSNFMFYHAVSDMMNVKVCPCLGNLAAKLPFSPQQVSNLLTFSVLFLFLGSTTLVLQRWSESTSNRLVGS